MKNNLISLSQFCFSSFISSLSILLFINNSVPLLQLLPLLIFEIIVFIVLYFYKGKINPVVKFVSKIYILLITVLVLTKFVIFMHKEVKSGPYWAILILVLLTVMFCNNNGVEAVFRSAVIVSFFVILFLLYLISLALSDFSLSNINIFNNLDIYPSILTFYPVATFIVFKENIKIKKKTPVIVNNVTSFLVVSFFLIYSNSINTEFPLFNLLKKANIGVFKGGDFLLTTVITLACVYLILISISALTLTCKNNRSNYLYLAIILIVSLLILYIDMVKIIIFSPLVIAISTLVMIISVIINIFLSRLKNYE